MIELIDITKTYTVNKKKIVILNKFNIKVPEKSFSVVMGPSGSGKSTLLNIMGGLLTPDSGEVKINNKNILKLNDNELSNFRNKNLGFIFQNFNLQNYYTALENVELPLIFSDIKEKERKVRAEKLLNDLGLAHRINHKPTQLSGGEIQRVAVARALINKANIILADEPTGNIDVKASESLIELLVHINKKYGVTVLVVTHDEIFKKYTENIIEINNENELII